MSETKLGAGKRRQMRAKLRESRDARLSLRLLAMLECERGMPVRDVAELLGVSRQSVYNWIGRAHERNDVDQLCDAPRSGRPAKTGRMFDALLPILLKLPPTTFGYQATYWTVPLLKDQLQQNLEQEYSDDTIRRGLHRLGYVWKRPRYVLMPDPAREKKTPNSAHPLWQKANAQCFAG